MSTDNDEPAIVKLGAGTDDSTRGVNLDVSGTVGPDYLGQETTTVDGHPNDRPGVLSRLPESTGGDDPRIRRMDTGEELPVLLESSMRADPIEAVQGSYTEIVEGFCARCGYDRLKRSVATLPGETQEVCNACGAIQDHRADDGYRMPQTEKDRARMRREAGPTLGELTTRTVVDLEPDTGFGPRVALVEERSSTSYYKSDIEELFWMLVENDDIDIEETLDKNLRGVDRAAVTMTLMPDSLAERLKDDE